MMQNRRGPWPGGGSDGDDMNRNGNDNFSEPIDSQNFEAIQRSSLGMLIERSTSAPTSQVKLSNAFNNTDDWLIGKVSDGVIAKCTRPEILK